MLEGQTVEMGFAAGKFPLEPWDRQGGKARQEGDQPALGELGQSRIKAPELSLGENLVKGLEVEKMGGGRKSSPSSLLLRRHPELRLELH